MSEAPFDLGQYDRNELLTKAADFLILQHYAELWNAMSENVNQVWVSITVEYVSSDHHWGSILTISSFSTD